MTPLSLSLADPVTPSPLAAAVSWVQGVMLGEIATAVAIIAVAVVGAMMLTGRTDLRRGLTVVLGCFVLFGATTIAAGIRSAADAGRSEAEVASSPPPATLPSPKAPTQPPLDDPYAGASVFIGRH